MRLKLHIELRNFWVLSTSLINFGNNQSPQIFYWLEVWRAHWEVKKFYSCSSKFFLVIDALWIAALSCRKIHSSPHRRCPFCVREKSFNHIIWCFLSTTDKLQFTFSWRWKAPLITKDPIPLCLVELFSSGNLFSVLVILIAIWTVKIEFLFVRLNNFSPYFSTNGLILLSIFQSYLFVLPSSPWLMNSLW